MLISTFPGAIAYYDCDHMITKIGGKLYDITGEVEIGTHLPIEEQPKVRERIEKIKKSRLKS